MLKKFLSTILFFSSFSQIVSATELKPWYDNEAEIEIRPSYLFQTYDKVHAEEGTLLNRSNNHFFNLSGAINYNKYSAEVEIETQKTAQHDFGMNAERCTFRHIVLDDVIGDPVSLSAGLTLTHVYSQALHDISNFYHGDAEFEGHLSVGKESICEEFWTSHWWAVLGLGIANAGSPWIRANVTWEKNVWDTHQFRLFANTLWGLGDHGLNLTIPFEGYGPIMHQSIDLGVGYSYWFEPIGTTINLDYAYRPYSKNAPAGVNSVLLTLLIPYNL